jgi:hypothetical protein
MARPSTFTDALFAGILDRIADGESLRGICRDDGMPAARTVLRWIQANPDLQRSYTLATEIRVDTIFDELLDIADDARDDWMEKVGRDGKNQGYALNAENIRRSALRIDARKWTLARMAPKKYGDRVDVNHGAQDSFGDFLAALDGKTRGIPSQGAVKAPGARE